MNDFQKNSDINNPKVASADWREPSKDTRSNQELFAASLEGDHEDEPAWDAVRALRVRGTMEVFELAKINSKSENPKARARALDILGQLGAGKPTAERPYLEESIALAINGTSDIDPKVLHAAAWALAHLGGEHAATSLIKLKSHSDPDVRHAVAFGLHGSQSRAGVEILFQLMEDDDDVVRDWATFALGQGSPSQDSEEIREALRKRLADTYEDARDEALWGLAMRKDNAALKSLLERLESGSWKSGDEMAAEETLNLIGNISVEQLRAGIRELINEQ